MDITCDETDFEHDSDLISSTFAKPLQRFDDYYDDVMTGSKMQTDSATIRPNRSILKKNREIGGCEVQARSSRSKSVTFCVPDETPRKGKERNPILKVLEAFDRKLSQDCEISPSKSKLNAFERKHDDKSGSPNKSDGNLPYWIAYLHINAKRRCNPMERARRSDIKRQSGTFVTYRSNSLNSERSIASPLKRHDHPFWTAATGDDVGCRCTYRHCTKCSQIQQESANANMPLISNSNNDNNNILVSTKALSFDGPLSRKLPNRRDTRNSTCTAPSY